MYRYVVYTPRLRTLPIAAGLGTRSRAASSVDSDQGHRDCGTTISSQQERPEERLNPFPTLVVLNTTRICDASGIAL